MIKLVCVGRIKEKALQSLIEEYLKRLQPYTKVAIIEVDDVMAPQSNSEAQNEQVMNNEGKKLLSQIKDNEYVILLDLKGQMWDSLELAEQLDKIQTYTSPDITFVIGGSLGTSKEVFVRADAKWQLSKLTFVHQMVRLIVLEQIYRSYKIRRNEPYHK